MTPDKCYGSECCRTGTSEVDPHFCAVYGCAYPPPHRASVITPDDMSEQIEGTDDLGFDAIREQDA